MALPLTVRCRPPRRRRSLLARVPCLLLDAVLWVTVAGVAGVRVVVVVVVVAGWLLCLGLFGSLEGPREWLGLWFPLRLDCRGAIGVQGLSV